MNHVSTAPFSVLLRNARKRAGMTQRQLADLSTISVRAIRDLELERTRAPRTETIRLLADALRLGENRRTELERAAGQIATESLADDLTAPPAPLGPIIGREHEVDSLVDVIESGGHRLVVVAGMLGIGKTRLIQEVARRIHRDGPMPVICTEQDRASAVGRSRLSPQESLIRRIAEPLGCRPTLDDLLHTLGDSEILITVDGQDLDEDADLALRLLLRRCPRVRVLYERCERWSPHGDLVFSVFPLAVTEWGYGESPVAELTEYSSVQFMRAHCAQLHAERASDPTVLNAIAGICWCLDGNPAALESVASWLLLYSAAELLDTAKNHPLMLTRSPGTGADPLTAWLSRTVGSLSYQESELLSRLVDAEPWTVEQAVDSIDGPAVEVRLGIHALRACGLVRRTDPLNRERPRFTVLNLVRHHLRMNTEPQPVQVPHAPPKTGHTDQILC